MDRLHRAATAFIIGIALLVCTHAHAQADPQDHTPLATVFGTILYADDLVHHSAIDRMKTKLDPDAFDIWFARAREEALRSTVWTALFSNYPGATHVDATPAEINLFIVYARNLRMERRARRQMEYSKLTEELKNPALTEARRKTIEKYLEGSTAWLDRFDQLERERVDPKRAKIRAGLDERAAEVAVEKWKLNQLIFREFGGRIAFGRDGWEPYDAFRKLAEREEKNKNVQFQDPLMREAFFATFSHDFHYADEKQAQFYFEKPYWERTIEEMRNAGFKEVSDLSQTDAAE
jgi:hypothetical protein